MIFLISYYVQLEKWVAEDLMGLNVLEGSSRTMVTNSKKSRANELANTQHS